MEIESSEIQRFSTLCTQVESLQTSLRKVLTLLESGNKTTSYEYLQGLKEQGDLLGVAMEELGTLDQILLKAQELQ